MSLPYDEEPSSTVLFSTLRVRATRFEQLLSERQNQLDISGEVERLLRNKPRGESVSATVALDSRVFGPNATLTPNRVEVDAVLKADRSVDESLRPQSERHGSLRSRAVPNSLFECAVDVRGAMPDAFVRAHEILKEDHLALESRRVMTQ